MNIYDFIYFPFASNPEHTGSKSFSEHSLKSQICILGYLAKLGIKYAEFYADSESEHHFQFSCIDLMKRVVFETRRLVLRKRVESLPRHRYMPLVLSVNGKLVL